MIRAKPPLFSNPGGAGPPVCRPHAVAMRWFATLLLLAALALPSAPATSAQCGDDAEGSAALDVIEQAYNDITLLYYQPIDPADVLTPARDAAADTLGIEDAAGAAVADWMAFQDDFCSLWELRGNGVGAADVAHPAIQAMASALDEPHTQFYPPDAYQEYLQEAAGDVHYEGIGAQLRGDPLRIERVFTGTPAEQAGLRRGDRIMAIDGQPTTDFTPADAARLVRGPEGTTVHLTIARPGETSVREIDVQRAPIRVPTVETRMIESIAYLRIGDFGSEGIPSLVQSALQDFQRQNATGLILDLRGNPGGRLDIGTQIAEYLLPANAPIFQEVTRAGEAIPTTSSGTRLWDKRIDVLIDDGSASMAEILAAALREEAGAKLIGTTTAGAVAASVVLPLQDGAGIQVTIQRVDSAEGNVINNVGLTPDVIVDEGTDPIAATRDEPLEVALADLRGTAGSSGGSASATSPPTPRPAAGPQTPAAPTPTPGVGPAPR